MTGSLTTLIERICNGFTAAEISFSRDALWEETETGAQIDIGAASVQIEPANEKQREWAMAVFAAP